MNQSLQGLRILNTRPPNQAQALNQIITNSGGIVIACNTLEIKAVSSTFPDINAIDKAIFVSVNAVKYCFTQLKQLNLHWPEHIHVIAIGLGTASMLKEYSIAVHELPDVPDSEHLLTLKSLETVKNQRVLLVKGQGGRTLIEEGLRQRGADVINLVVYERVCPVISRDLIYSIWHNDLVDVILITSEYSLENLFKLFGCQANEWLISKTYWLISERLAKIATSFGIKKIIISHPTHMTDSLFAYYKGLSHDR
jgi:uroporphyrinogen-III synthase